VQGGDHDPHRALTAAMHLNRNPVCAVSPTGPQPAVRVTPRWTDLPTVGLPEAPTHSGQGSTVARCVGVVGA